MGFLSNYIMNFPAVAFGRQPKRPLLFSYYITHDCELNCHYCSDGQGKPFKQNVVSELSTNQAKKLISILRNVTDTLDITGGEPLIRHDLEEILYHARQLGFRIVLNTKGTNLPARRDLLQLVDVLVIGVDSLKTEKLAQIIGGGTAVAESILASLNWVIENHLRFGTKIIVAAVALPDNLEDVGEILKYTIEHDVGFLISPEIAGTTVHPDLQNNTQLRKLIDRVIMAKKHGATVLGVVEYLGGIKDLREFRCYPLLMPTIRPDGKMYYPCLEIGKAKVNVIEAGNYWSALARGRAHHGTVPKCHGCCHIFCHMAVSLLQRHPISALRELNLWRQ